MHAGCGTFVHTCRMWHILHACQLLNILHACRLWNILHVCQLLDILYACQLLDILHTPGILTSERPQTPPKRPLLEVDRKDAFGGRIDQRTHDGPGRFQILECWTLGIFISRRLRGFDMVPPQLAENLLLEAKSS